MGREEDIRIANIMPKLSERWSLVEWGSCLRNVKCPSDSYKQTEYQDKGKHPIIDQGQTFISGYTDEEKLIYKDDLPVIIFGDHTRVIKYIDFSFALGADGCKILVPVKEITTRFFYHYLMALNLSSVGYSRHYKFLKTISVPVAPLNEQKRIVEKLDTILPKVKNAKARLENIPKILKKFRQSVLSDACSGKLTEEWREGKELPEWEDKEFFDFFVLQRGYDLVLSKIESGEYPVVTSAGISGFHKIFKSKAPGVVTGRSGSVGNVFYIEKDFWPHNTTLFVKDFKNNLQKYVYYFLLGFDITHYSASTAVPTLNRNNLREIYVKVPPIEEQHEIVRRVEKLFALADSLEEKYKTAIARVEKIEQSVLAKAFRGELVEPDPNDEPAEILLKRILDVRAKNLSPQRKTGKKKKGVINVAPTTETENRENQIRIIPSLQNT